ncbi:MAG: HoxN/HupN/NixA family nickel/cobalt transporter [Rhodanobacteraceae bacterium]
MRKPRSAQVREAVVQEVIAQRAPPVALHFSAAEWMRLAGYYGCIALLHVSGWGLFLYYSARYPSMVGLGLAAYLFGLRHAFDADHIAAVDDTVRYLMQKKRQPLGVGFFFSLGHSTVVFVLAVAIIFAAATIKHGLPVLQQYGGVIGAMVSGSFLWLIGILNLVLLLDMLRVWKQARAGAHSHTHVEQLLARRGLLNRLFGARLRNFIQRDWQIYPVGVLFGLGFDTASEIGLLAMTAGAATGALPVGAALALPLLFTAGMTAMDTTDGVLMTKAYNWAFVNPLRKIFYNLTTTTLSIAVALVIGSVELIQVLANSMGWHGGLLGAIVALDFGTLGYVIVGLFLFAWAVSVAVWKLGHFDQHYQPRPVEHRHEHVHADINLRHSHRHIH